MPNFNPRDRGGINPPRPDPYKRVLITMNEPLLDRLDQERGDTPRSTVIEQAVREFLDRVE